ncbi:hypothetical protein PXD04_08665 [Methanosphaera sp. ISO3-F5]|uniref:hypothetical protein n=1 Tax=Methanosphaera sp. ISO3-F5 TaxID=1452353 RepID=UPI002B25E4C4|nr:hypothetical protein [Methanosphaera sp. ISO3-F5]WQH63762.1 hypothetical protein PXD04_08665 [Methanosphaera sp. ISO3-F5]
MQNDMLNKLIQEFNETIDLLIKDFKEFNYDEKALGFLATRTRTFITFCNLSLNNIIFAVLKRTKNYNFDEEIKQSKDIINNIFEKINHSLDHILEHDHEEEHAHDHSHEHHIHIDVEDVQDDINNIQENLELLKELFKNLSDFVVTSVKYQINNINDEVFKNEFEKFKTKLAEIQKQYNQN